MEILNPTSRPASPPQSASRHRASSQEPTPGAPVTPPPKAIFVESFADIAVVALARTCETIGCGAQVVLTNDEDVSAYRLMDNQTLIGGWTTYFGWKCSCGHFNEVLSICALKSVRCPGLIEAIEHKYAEEKITIPLSAVRSAYARW